MGLIEIAASFAAAILVGTLTRGAWRTYFLLTLSVFAVYWLQPAIPLRSFDFWLPSLTLAFVILTWLITSKAGAWRESQNRIALFIIVGIATVTDLSRYVLPKPILIATTPPQIFQYLILILILAIIILSLFGLSRRQSWILSFVVVVLIAILLILKSPALSLRANIFFRIITHRTTENALATDLRWLGFSYIAFRLIHVLRDKQTNRLPELSLGEFATYVVFFPSLAAGPIDRAERFAQDLRKEFKLTQDETLSAGQRIVIGLFKKFVIADALALIALNDALATQVRTTGWMWIVVYAYAFQIYFDFSGYTDVAIGIGRLAGIKLPENFAAPYLKPNITQFWNSWHMTLTQWIRSYFFNPFNRWIRGYKSIPAWTMILIGQVATMLLIGLWHGVTINFILWSLWHGLGLFFQNRWSDFTKNRFNASSPRLKSALQIGGVLLTFHFVALGWVFFALRNPYLSWMVFGKLFNLL
jgi:D-alanyl-lipoteichoic acid acyltransferase DltB (MBOAT superfamily)